ncbi:nuclear transport factor 2 family protein [Sediminitomix flava]|uniref:Ketosteroid isomerase-like protein n=1 Tax=Sediminitomix flava TaxID=379075 RepID=A0A315Z774_SEDFL|nr:nuclear transport factor 2 family protein [Sediminitomix flava]PWJ40072.1 ketosteroid isomerase-like protein [Sediminitomix flava]
MNRYPFIHQFYKALDEGDLLHLQKFLTRDSIVSFAHHPPIIGRDQIGESFLRFFEKFSSITHRTAEKWETPDALIIRGESTYRFKGEEKLIVIPYCHIFKFQDNRVFRFYIYADIFPLGKVF